MACFFQQHLADQEGAGAIGNPIGIEINAFTAGMAHGGISTGGAVEFAVAAKFHREAEAIAGQLELQRCKALIKQGCIGASRAEGFLDDRVEVGLVGEAGEGLVGACQGLLPGLLGAIG